MRGAHPVVHSKDDDPWAVRAEWRLSSERIAKNPDGLDLPALLDRIVINEMMRRQV